MNESCVTLTASKPTAAELAWAIRDFHSSEEKPGMQLIRESLPIVGEACARLDGGASRDEVIGELGELGLDRESATTFVDMAARVLALNDAPPADASEGGSMVSALATLLVIGAIGSAIMSSF